MQKEPGNLGEYGRLPQVIYSAKRRIRSTSSVGPVLISAFLSFGLKVAKDAIEYFHIDHQKHCESTVSMKRLPPQAIPLFFFLIVVLALAFGFQQVASAQEPASNQETAAAKNAPEKSDDQTSKESSENQPSVDADMADAWSTVDGIVDGFISALPKILIAIVVFTIFVLIAWVTKLSIRSVASRNDSSALGNVLGRLSQAVILFVGFMIAAAIISKSVTPAKLLSVLGVGGVAIGFAFKDLLQNFMAGILILLRRPFEVGDQVVFGEHEGTIESIDTRSTVVKTYSGERVLIPNGEVYTNPMKILTAYEKRRSQYDVGIGYGDDIDVAKRKMIEAMEGVEGVLSDPAPEVLIVELAGSSVNLRGRWWTDPRRSDVVHVKSEVIEAFKRGLDEAQVDMPYPTQVTLLHDQTEASDGDRTKQREGWPAGDNPPEPATMAQAVRNLNNEQRAQRSDSEKNSQSPAAESSDDKKSSEARGDSTSNGRQTSNA